MDKVFKMLPIPDYDKVVEGLGLLEPETYSTLGGISLSFSRFFDSSIVVRSDVTNFGSDIDIVGSFAASYAQFPRDTTSIDALLSNTYSSPMDELLDDIRDVMFRSSVAIAEQKIADFIWIDPGQTDAPSTHVSSQKFTHVGEYKIYHTVYKTNNLTLVIVMVLMSCNVLAVIPLYQGFWRLGRKVSLSPLEVEKALRNSAITDPETGAAKAFSVLDITDRSVHLPQSGSNLQADELVKVLRKTKVRYGEVAPNILGMGLTEYTVKARRGWLYY